MITPEVLRVMLEDTVNDLEDQIMMVRARARDMGIDEHQMQDTSGGWVMTPLLVAKVQALDALTRLSKEH